MFDSVYHFSTSAASPTLADIIINLMEAHSQSEKCACSSGDDRLDNPDWMENPDSCRDKELILPVYFFLWRACVPIWLAYDGPALFVYLLMSLRASSSPPGFYELVFEPPQLRVKHAPVVVSPGLQPVSSGL